MIRRLLIALVALAGCTDGTNPLALTLGSPAESAAFTERRAQVEVFVKTNHPALIRDIAGGGGPALTQAFDIAGVPPQDRIARSIQLQSDLSLHQSAPGALINALMLYAR